MPKKQNCPEQRTTAAQAFQNRRLHSTQPRRLPPYANHLRADCQELIILTGAGAWDRAKSETWFHKRKLVLPFGESPERHRWPVHGLPCMVCSFGDPEARETLIELSVTLIENGSPRVIWAVPGEMPVFRPRADA